MTERPANRLALQTSPYLLQHAHNPVDWYPWGEEALARAREHDRPIFLSIGYAACHWCHVMERESFEDPGTAALMNEHFVSIKVDREERPDLDGIYMDAVQAMNGHGGWPLSAFLSPDGEPFYAGTYYPLEPAHGMPSFRQVLTGIAEAWRDRREELLEQGSRVAETIARAGELEATQDPLTPGIADRAEAGLARTFDEQRGGFGGAPKFPQPMVLEFLLRRAVRGSTGARDMVVTTLDAMAGGGIYDQLGGGFARYSTDAAWHVPHFEKMLYDNAQLLRLYVRAWQVTRAERYRVVATETAEYLLREMQHPQGGFFSSQDADSEGVEGRFFVWDWRELVELAGEDAARAFGAEPLGNWEGTNVLWRPSSSDTQDVPHTDLDRARTRLFEARERRVHPGTDDKVLAAWNGLATGALAETGRVLGKQKYVDAAVRSADFVMTHLLDDEGRLTRSWRAGVPGGAAFADDHALMAAACLTLHETTFELRWFEAARGLADELLERFHDPQRGGFFQTASDAERLLLRPKELYDNAAPGGNAAAADMLLRLALLTGEDRYRQAADGALRLVREAIATSPSGFGHALCALDLALGPAREVAVIGALGDPRTQALVQEVTVASYRPNVVLAVAEPGDAPSGAAIALLRDRVAPDAGSVAYVCERFACRLPVHTPEALADQLSG